MNVLQKFGRLFQIPDVFFRNFHKFSQPAASHIFAQGREHLYEKSIEECKVAGETMKRITELSTKNCGTFGDAFWKRFISDHFMVVGRKPVIYRSKSDAGCHSPYYCPLKIARDSRTKEEYFCSKKDPCKKNEDSCDKKKDDPCKKKDDPCKKKEESCGRKKEDPCKKADDPCKKKQGKKKKVPCKTKDDPYKKKEDQCKKKDDPCKKKQDSCGGKKKEDPCKKKDDTCKKKQDSCGGKKKEDPCKKKDDPSKKKQDSCGGKKKEDPCKRSKQDSCGSKKEDPCKKKDDPCKKKQGSGGKKKEDPCKKKQDSCGGKKKDDPCKKKDDPCKKKCSVQNDECKIENPLKLRRQEWKSAPSRKCYPFFHEKQTSKSISVPNLEDDKEMKNAKAQTQVDVFTKVDVLDEKKLAAVDCLGDEYKNKEYFAYKDTAFYDLNVFLEQQRHQKEKKSDQ